MNRKCNFLSNHKSTVTHIVDERQISDIRSLTCSLVLHAPVLPLPYLSFSTISECNSTYFHFKDMFPCWRKFVRRCVFSEYCEKILCKKISHPEFESTQQSRFLDFNAYKMRIKADEFYHSNILNLDMKVARNYLKLIFSVWTFCIVI